MHGRVAGAAVAVAALALPAAASAATKTVQVGPFAKAQQFQAAFADANQYFRGTVTIHKGDRVTWKINGFHTVTFVPKGDPPPGLIAPDLATPVAGVQDVGGADFWFNGQPTLRPNPLTFAKQGGSRFDPDALANSGVTPEGEPPPYTLKFDQTGTFRYLCVIHPGMAGKVRVVGRGKTVPSARQDKRAAKRELAATLKAAKRLSAGRGTEGLRATLQAGNDRTTGATVFKYFPANPTFKVGETVTLQMPPRTTEVHTFTFGPTNGKDAYNDQLATAFLGPVFDPRGAYPSEPPPAVPGYDGANHGNGFYNSGVLDQDPASPLPASTQVTFTAPGSYSLICIIHPFMTATVTVSP